MDGGVANTARANTTVLTQAVNRQIWCMLLLLFNRQHNARPLHWVSLHPRGFRFPHRVPQKYKLMITARNLVPFGTRVRGSSSTRLGVPATRACSSRDLRRTTATSATSPLLPQFTQLLLAPSLFRREEGDTERLSLFPPDTSLTLFIHQPPPE